MKLPLKWLKEYVNFDVTVDEFVEKMMWRGFETAAVLDEMQGISNVFVCTITEIKQHENADKLRVCTIDVGKASPLQIVTNAKNVYEGAQVPVALDGATLSGGFKIATTVMRGVQSDGMFCSGKELNLTDVDYPGASEDLVLIFHEKHPNGQRIQEAVDLDSVVFDIELTPNRADCQSIIGICREAAAALDQKFIEPVIKTVTGIGSASDYASVTIENSTLCSRYTAGVVTDLVIQPSPVWMQKKLKSVGLRPINNIVDITNYILIEYGHPMHAFDLSCVEGGNIVVRNAKDKEIIVTLDGKERICDSEMLLIADPKKGVGLAGVMGGENSEITEKTKAVLFESAAFTASNIRATTRKLHHVTDAAQRFMRGVEPNNAYLALKRALELVEELKAGKVVGDIIDVYPNAQMVERTIDIDCNNVNKIIGSDFTAEYMAELLGKINIEAKCVDNSHMKVKVPFHRTDIESSIESDSDIAEEVARLHGYYKIEPKLMSGSTFSGKLSEEFADDDKLHDVMVSLGAYEMYNYNFMSPTTLDILMINEDDEKRKAVRILNPFGEDQSLMRTTLIPGILSSLSLNIKRKSGHGRFFEIGNVHIGDSSVMETLPEERKKLGIAFMGDKEDFFSLKGTVEQLLSRFFVSDYKFKVGGGNYLCPGKKATISVAEDCIGEIGAIHPNVLKAYDIDIPCYIAELDVKKLLSHKGKTVKYKQLPKFPSAERDIAVVVDKKTECDAIKQLILSISDESENGVLVENAELFDVYTGIGIPSEKKSMAFSFSLRNNNRTLTDVDISGAMERIIKTLEEKAGAKLR